MSKGNESWGRFAAKAAMLGAVVLVAAFVGVRLAGADPGNPVRKALTVSGTLTGPMVTSNTMATFRFFRADMGGMLLCAPVVAIRNGIERDPTTGAFSVEVPLERTGGAADQQCPGTLFHDPNAYVEVVIGGTTVVPRRPINPVPYAVYAQQYGTPDCPVGYERTIDDGEGFPEISVRRLCTLRRADRTPADQVVRVGSGASAFWIDRYEARVLASDGESDCGGAGFPIDGQPTSASCVARSRAGVLPSSANWFQANRVCAASGKRLANGTEWLLAASGTSDPATGTDHPYCVTDRSSGARPTGGRAGCVSAWGAEDMIGNMSEWTSEWYLGLGAFNPPQGWVQGDAGTDWARGDTVINGIGQVAGDGPMGRVGGIPAGALRGGYFRLGAAAGVFHLDLLHAPSGNASQTAGVRCVIPR